MLTLDEMDRFRREQREAADAIYGVYNEDPSENLYSHMAHHAIRSTIWLATKEICERLELLLTEARKKD